MNVLVVVPTYNERENLPQLVPAVLGQGEQFHVLVECTDEAMQVRLLERFRAEGLACRALLA